MKKIKKFNLVCLMIFAVLFVAQMAETAPEITSAGDWTSQVIGSANLVAGAGSALTSTYESSTTQITLEILNTLAGPYNVSIKRTDTNWDTSVILSARRTDDGAGAGTIANGLAYQAIDVADQPFFSGTDDRSAVHVRLRLSNITVQVSPDTYSTTITFTVSP